jgi:uncharacterized membrane-anchored protein
LGKTRGDAIAMTMNWGYLTGTALFVGLLAIHVAVQIKTKKFHPAIYSSFVCACFVSGRDVIRIRARSAPAQ